MAYFNIFLIAIALSFDAMAVAAVNGARHHLMSVGKSLRIAFFFGLFQLLMPLIGWVIGIGFEKIIKNYDHWVAFILLVGIGAKIILESQKPQEEKKNDIYSFKILILLAIATSIDALVVGITFGFLPINIWFVVIIIGLTTFMLSLISVYIGKKFGESWSKKAEIVGGLILIGIGIKILISHLMS